VCQNGDTYDEVEVAVGERGRRQKRDLLEMTIGVGGPTPIDVDGVDVRTPDFLFWRRFGEEIPRQPPGTTAPIEDTPIVGQARPEGGVRKNVLKAAKEARTAENVLVER
jgi:hypothetical protein